MFLVFPFVLLFSLNKRQASANAVYTICRIWAKVWYLIIFIRHKRIYSAPNSGQQQYIYVANHCSYIDIPQLLRATQQPIRVLGRHDLAKVPVFGIIYRSATILVDRSNRENRAKSLTRMKEVLNNGISIFIFPEGSFNETNDLLKSFYDGAFKLSMDTNIAIKPIIFPDSGNRLHYKSIFSFTPGISRSVFLEAAKPDSYNNVQAFKQAVFTQMENALCSYKKA